MASTLQTRLFSSILLWCLISTAIVFRAEWMISGIAVVFGSASLWELTRLLPKDAGWTPYRWVSLTLGLGYWLFTLVWCLSKHSEVPLWVDAVALVAAVQLAFVVTLFRPLEGWQTLTRIATVVFAISYCCILFGFIVRIIYFSTPDAGPVGVYLMLFSVMVTKFSDMGAYAIGSLIGKHKMIPHISPAKSWEGFMGAFLGGFLGAGVMLHFFLPQLKPLNTVTALALVPLLVLAGITGDLAESVIKRCTATKDSGHSLPGLGGVLDVTDSIIFTAPIAYAFLKLIAAVD